MSRAFAIEFWGDTVERISKIDPVTGDTIVELDRAVVYPATHFVTERPTVERAVAAIRAELQGAAGELRAQNKLLEAQRLESRTHFDVDMLLEVGTLRGHRELLAPSDGAPAGGAPGVPARLFPG